MSRDDGKAEALHLATYSGWYRFEERDHQWMQTDRALTFWKMSSLQVDPDDPAHIYFSNGTFGTLHHRQRRRGMAAGEAQRAAPDHHFTAGAARNDTRRHRAGGAL
jgi:hypothetical protein